MSNRAITRRHALLSAGALALVGVAGPSSAQFEKSAADLKPGEWAWYPERAMSGPVAVIVSLSDQLAFVYRNGVRIGVSTVSTGRKGYETPTGVFTVLIKEKMHHSRAYNNAAMPDSQFFFGGCALHAGGLPGYPSSHGCVHLPRAFADLVFGVTHNGTPVIVTNERSGVGSLSHAGLVLTNSDLKAVEQLTGHVAGKKLPTDRKGSDQDALAIVVSGADSQLIALKNGEEFISTAIGIDRPRFPLGTHAYLLKGVDAATHTYDWMAVGLGTGHEEKIDRQREIAASARLVIPPEVYAKIARNLHPGATMMITDLPAHPGTRSGADFVIMRDSSPA